MEASRTFEHWHDFFLLVGTAGATLVALLFVAVSLGTGFLTEKRAAATRVFYSPVVVHFTAVFFIAAVGIAPARSPAILAATIGAASLFGIGVSVFAIVQLLRHRWTQYVRDHLAYGVLPAMCYAALIAAAAMIYTKSEYAAEDLACALLLLMIVNIRNAWDLMLSMVRHQAKRR